MKKIKWLLCMTMLFTLIMTGNVDAMNIVSMDSSQYIDSEYAFQPNFIYDKTNIELVDVKNFNVIKVTDHNPNIDDRYAYHLLPKQRGMVLDCSWIYHNVGVYKGKVIDIKVTLKGVPDTLRDIYEGIWIDTTGIGFMAEKCTAVYEFFDHETHKPIHVKGNMTGIDLDYEQNLTMKQGVETVYIFTDSVVYQKGMSIMSRKEMTDGIKDKRGMFTLLFDGDVIEFDWCKEDLGNNRFTQGYISFIPQGFLNTKTPPPTETVDLGVCKLDQQLTYNIYQQVPFQFQTNYYDQFVIGTTLDDVLNIIEANIYDEKDIEATDKFSISISNNTVEATAINLNDEDFYNHYYRLEIKTSIIQPNIHKYTSNIGSYIQDKAYTKVNTDILESNIVKSNVVYDIESTINNGYISNSKLNIQGGNNYSFEFYPYDNYYIDSIMIDGTISDTTSPYTFKTIDNNHRIDVVCKPYYKIDTKVRNGTITESIKEIKGGMTHTISYAPKPGYYLQYIRVDDKFIDINKYKDSYTFTDINANHTIEVVYRNCPILMITKTVDEENYNADNAKKHFIFKITSMTEDRSFYRTISLADHETTKTIVIDDLPSGTYYVEELDTIRFTLQEVKGHEGAFQMYGRNMVMLDNYDVVHYEFINKQTNYEYLSHNALCVNEIR